MISYAEACRIAQREAIAEQLDGKYVDVIEISDRWSFSFLTKDPEKYPYQLSEAFWVHKADGRVEWYSVPTMELLDELQAGLLLEFISE